MQSEEAKKKLLAADGAEALASLEVLLGTAMNRIVLCRAGSTSRRRTDRAVRRKQILRQALRADGSGGKRRRRLCRNRAGLCAGRIFREIFPGNSACLRAGKLPRAHGAACRRGADSLTGKIIFFLFRACA